MTKQVSVNGTRVILAITTVINHMNRLLRTQARGKRATLVKRDIKNARLSLVNAKYNATEQNSSNSHEYEDVTVTFTTLPGGALFECTVRCWMARDMCEVMGDISRINLYVDQSHCVHNRNLKKMCFCKDLL